MFYVITGSNSYANTPSPINTSSPRSIQYHPAPSPSGSYASLMTPSSVSSPGLAAPSLTSFGNMLFVVYFVYMLLVKTVKLITF